MADQNSMRKSSDKRKDKREHIAGSEETRACLRECFGSVQVDLHRRLSPAVRVKRMPSLITQMKRSMSAANGGVLWRPCSTSCAAEAAKMERETASYPDDTPPNSQPTARRVREGLGIPPYSPQKECGCGDEGETRDTSQRISPGKVAKLMLDEEVKLAMQGAKAVSMMKEGLRLMEEVEREEAEREGVEPVAVTPGLISHIAYCKKNSVTKWRAVEHFAKAYNQFCGPLEEGETIQARMEKMLDSAEFEKDTDVGLWEYVFTMVSRCG